MKILLIILLTISQALCIEVTPMSKGDKAPKQGFFIDTENMKEMRKINEKKKLLEKENVTLKDLAVINEKRVEVYKERADETEKHLTKEKTKGNIKGVLGFILGVAATSLAAFAASKAIK